jgi:hypothetical protein
MPTKLEVKLWTRLIRLVEKLLARLMQQLEMPIDDWLRVIPLDAPQAFAIEH